MAEKEKKLRFWNLKDKKIKELEEEIDYLNDVVEFQGETLEIHKLCFFGLATRIANVENLMVALGMADYKSKQKQEKPLLN